MAKNASGNLQAALNKEKPLVVMGTPNAYCALLAQQAGLNAIYLSGAGVANSSLGLPDLALTSLKDVAEETHRITAVCPLPLLVDADTGWDNPALTVITLSAAGAAGIHLEDQVEAKRCGHLPGKKLVSSTEMVERIEAAINARVNANFVIMARTDAFAVEGMQAAIERAKNYCDAGADMIFAESLTDLDHYRQFSQAVPVPVLANITEFGKTPLFSVSELGDVGVALVLYPLSAFRAMSAAATKVYETIRIQGTQKDLVDSMQSRKYLYEILNYEQWQQDREKLLHERKKSIQEPK